MSQKQSRPRRNYKYWCITAWVCPTPDMDRVAYTCWQQELTPTKGKLHYQTLLVCRTATTYGAAMTMMGLTSKTCHIEAMQGTYKQAREYTFKDKTAIPDTYVEHGIAPGTAVTTSTSDAEPTSMYGRIAAHLVQDPQYQFSPAMVARCGAGIERARLSILSNLVPPWRDITVNVHYGPPGTGKDWSISRVVASQPHYYLKFPRTGQSELYFQGYLAQEHLIISDFDGPAIQFRELLRLLDGYPYQLAIKYGHGYAFWTHVHISTNVHPGEWYPYAELPEGSKDALRRRITNIITYTEPVHPYGSLKVPTNIDAAAYLASMDADRPATPVPEPGTPVSEPRSPVRYETPAYMTSAVGSCYECEGCDGSHCFDDLSPDDFDAPPPDDFDAPPPTDDGFV